MKTGNYVALGFSTFLFILLSWELLTGLFLKPISAQISGIDVTFQYLTKTRIVKIDQIAGYSETVFSTKTFDYEGVLFYLKDGRKVELSEYNIKTIQPVCTYLKKQKFIPCFGTERSHMSCFPFKYKYAQETKEYVTS